MNGDFFNRFKTILIQMNELIKNLNNSKINDTPNFLKSFFFAIFSSTILFSGVISLADMAIKDGSAYDNSRWGMLGEAYQTINKSEGDSILFIGSSVSYFGIDGKCMEDNDPKGNKYWNLAIRGDMPYLRMLEIDHIIESGPKKIVLEAGPNSFQNGIGSIEERLRWQIFSLYNSVDIKELNDLILEDDKKYILDSEIQRLEFKQKSVGPAMNEIIRGIIIGDKKGTTGDGYLPEESSENWLNSLKKPPLSNRNSLTEQEWNGYIDRLAQSEFWIHSKGESLNRLAFNYMIEKFVAHDIEVILISLPLHGELTIAIPSNNWDNFNETRDYFANQYTFIDLTWEKWSKDYFMDPIHLSSEGRQRICENLVSEINY